MDNLIPLLAAVGFSLSILLLFVGISSISSSTATIQERLAEYGTRPMTLEEIELSQPFSERVIKPMLKGVAKSMARFTPQSMLRNTAEKLELAGSPYNWSAAEFLGLRVFAGLLLALIGFLLMSMGKAKLSYALGLSLILGLLGFNLPVIWLGAKIRSRRKEILRALPDALDLITISVEAGLGFDAALARVAEKWDNELSREFARALGEMRVGRPRHEALRDMAARAGIPEVANFVAAVIQADQLGVSIAKVMRVQSEQMRIRRRQKAEELAHKAPIKMIVPLVVLVFPSILIILLGPALISIKNSAIFKGLFG
ncbi:MAG: type II secretion system F family protein [Chloroflexi bacterium]|nr:MAG: type II secretion system F family protein [Chloroflexota bacterium]